MLGGHSGGVTSDLNELILRQRDSNFLDRISNKTISSASASKWAPDKNTPSVKHLPIVTMKKKEIVESDLKPVEKSEPLPP